MKTSTSSEAPVACRYLRAKHMYTPTNKLTAMGAGQEHGDQAFYWCNKTLGSLGPDDDRVHPCHCLASRRCHEV